MAGIILLMLAFVISPVNAVDDSATITDTGAAVVASGEDTQIVDDIEPEENIIGPDHVLYKLRMAFEDIDVAFTFNDTEKVSKQVSQARHRLAELKAAYKSNNEKAAESAIDQYKEETDQAQETISRVTGKDTGLIRAQARIANHSYVLQRMLESHPNNTGLLRAYNNSERLIEKFTSKTDIRFERWTDKNGRKLLKHIKVEDDGEDEKTSIKAEVQNNRTKVKVELKFLTNSTKPEDIAADISDRIAAIKDNVSGLIKIERDGEEDDGTDVTGGKTVTLNTVRATDSKEMKADAEVKGNTTRVKFDYTFFLGVTDDAAIIDAAKKELSTLTEAKILSVLDVIVKEQRVEIKETKQENGKNVLVEEKKPENKPGQTEKEKSGENDR